jgi:hypothetical protein
MWSVTCGTDIVGSKGWWSCDRRIACGQDMFACGKDMFAGEI